MIIGGEFLELDENFDKMWSVSSGRMLQPKCVPIPSNMTLCQNIGYNSMRIPNVLEHDSLEEATQQASSWKPLVGVRCHADTQIFLCSLFSPICLERVILPCRSLCEGVQRSCEGYMKRYGFPWPEMFQCDKFPADNDLCIPGRSSTTNQTVDDQVCQPCQEPDTYEGILDNYCKTQYVIRATIKGLHTESTTAEPGEVEINMGKRKKRFYKRDTNEPKKVYKLLAEKDAKIYISQGMGCTCDQKISPGSHHLMGVRMEKKYNSLGEEVVKFYADFITAWEENGDTKPGIKRALKAIRKRENVCQGGDNILNIHKQIEDEEKSVKRVKKNRKALRL
uniref:Soluble frizzled-related protein n=1 Tax=Bugula neritina TaxID=10212 RepID=I6WNP6_BUGNE|nr:soluble frizzled-related protein [Bugula neritina]